MADPFGPRVLIVEDDPLLSSLLAEKLHGEKFDLRSARTGEEALEIAKRDKPDMILLDLLLPGIDGFEVLRRLKEDPDTKNSVVIILSNLGQESDVSRGKELGAEKYIVKVSLTLSEVVDLVRNTWQKHATPSPAQS